MARWIPPALYARFLSEAVTTGAERLVELYEFTLPSGVRYWSQAGVTWRTQVYTALAMKRSEITNDKDATKDETRITFSNVGGTMRTLMASDEFLDCPVRIRLVIPTVTPFTFIGYSGTGAGKTATLSTVRPEQRDGHLAITYDNGTGLWTPVFTRHDEYVGGFTGTFGMPGAVANKILFDKDGQGVSQAVSLSSTRTTRRFVGSVMLAQGTANAVVLSVSDGITTQALTFDTLTAAYTRCQVALEVTGSGAKTVTFALANKAAEVGSVLAHGFMLEEVDPITNSGWATTYEKTVAAAGTRNALLYSENLTNAEWTKTLAPTITANFSAAPASFGSTDHLLQGLIEGSFGAGDTGKTMDLITTNNFLLFEGIAENPADCSEESIEVRVNGKGSKLLAPWPNRPFSRKCTWTFGPIATGLGLTSPCLYTGAAGVTGTTNGGYTGATRVYLVSAAQFANSVGATIKIGTNAEVAITAVNVASNYVDIASAQTWLTAVNVVFTSCRYTFSDCQDRARMTEYGGFRGLRTSRGVIQRPLYQNPAAPGAQIMFGAYGEGVHGLPPSWVRQAQKVMKKVPEPEDVVGHVYGRRVVQGTPIEWTTYDDNGSGRSAVEKWRAAFYGISAGELPDLGAGAASPVDRCWVGGKRRKNLVKVYSGTKHILRHGMFLRRGTAAVNTGDMAETNADYDSDSDTVVRAQNIDWQTGTGTAYNRLAYAIFRAIVDGEIWGGADATPELPDAFFRVLQGRKVQLYNADGSLNGAKQFTENPIWILVDILTDPLDGLGITVSEFNWRRIKQAADYCDVWIDSVEATTTVTAAVTSATISVKSTAGFKHQHVVYKNGSSTSQVVDDVLNSTTLVLSGAITVAVGDVLKMVYPRFLCDIEFRQRDKVNKLLEKILVGCRGYIAPSDGEYIIDIDRPQYERIVNGNFDTDLSGWTLFTTNGTVTRDTGTKYEGAASCKLHITATSSQVGIYQALTAAEPFGVYSLRFVAKGTDGTGESVKAWVMSGSYYLQNDGSWSLTPTDLLFPFVDATWHDFFLPIRVDPTLLGTSPTIYVNILASEINLVGQDIWIDSASCYGPTGGEYRDIGLGLSKTRAHILTDSSGFKQGLSDVQRETNEVKVAFQNSLGGTAYPPQDDAVTVRDPVHLVKHTRKALSLDAPGLSVPDQAVRIAKYHLWKARVLKEGATFRTGFAGLLAMPGDIIIVSHRAPGWSRRLMRVESVSVADMSSLEDFYVEIEASHWDPAIFTDIGEPSEIGVGAGMPSITLTIQAHAGRRLDLAWVAAIGCEPIDRYEVYVGNVTLNAADPDADYYQGKTRKTSFSFQIPEAWTGTGKYVYARVVAVLSSGEYSVSNEVNGSDDIANTQPQKKNLLFGPEFNGRTSVRTLGGPFNDKFWKASEGLAGQSVVYNGYVYTPKIADPNGGRYFALIADLANYDTLDMSIESGRNVSVPAFRLPRRFKQYAYYHCGLYLRRQTASPNVCADVPADCRVRMFIITDSGSTTILDQAAGGLTNGVWSNILGPTPFQVAVDPRAQTTFKFRVGLYSPGSGWTGSGEGLLCWDPFVVEVASAASPNPGHVEGMVEPGGDQSTEALTEESDQAVTGTRLHSGVGDYGGRSLQKMFAKAAAGDADSFDGIPDGSIHRKAPITQLPNLALDGGFEKGRRVNSALPARWLSTLGDTKIARDTTNCNAVGKASLKVIYDGTAAYPIAYQGGDTSRFPNYHLRVPVGLRCGMAIDVRRDASMPTGAYTFGVGYSGTAYSNQLGIATITLTDTAWHRVGGFGTYVNPGSVPTDAKLRITISPPSVPANNAFVNLDNLFVFTHPTLPAYGSTTPDILFPATTDVVAHQEANDSPVGDDANPGFLGLTNDFIPDGMGVVGGALFNYLVGGDFNQNVEWDKLNSYGVANVDSSFANCATIGTWTGSASGKPTIARAYPGGNTSAAGSAQSGGAQQAYRAFSKGSWVTVALSVKRGAAGVTPNADLKLAICQGAPTNGTSQADTETGFILLRQNTGSGYASPAGATIAGADIADAFQRFVFHFQFDASNPTTPGAGVQNQILLRTSATNGNYVVDKLMIVPGKWSLRNFPFNVSIQEIKAKDFYGDMGDDGSRGGMGSGESFTPDPTDGYARKKFSDTR